MNSSHAPIRKDKDVDKDKGEQRQRQRRTKTKANKDKRQKTGDRRQETRQVQPIYSS